MSISSILTTAGPRFICMLLLLIPASASVAGTLNVRQIYQEKDQWCWAASCEAVLEYYGIDETQTNIAIYGSSGNNVWNYLWGAGDPGDGIYRRGCNLIISYFGGVSGSGFTGVLSPEQLQAEIDGLRPVFINWEWSTGGGHILLASGMVNSNVYLMDPWYGPSVNDYDWVLSGGGHTWKWTIKISTPSSTTNEVPRWWLGSYGLTSAWAWASLAMDDQDNDGVPTWKEYIADTSPIDPASLFKLVISTNSVVSWTGSTNRNYTLERSTNMADADSWSNVPAATDVPGIGLMSYTNSSGSGTEFYRVNVFLQP